MRKLFSLLLVCLYPALISPLEAADYFVHPQGLDANPARTTSSPNHADHPTAEPNEWRRSLIPA